MPPGPEKQILRLMSLLRVGDEIKPVDYAGRVQLQLRSQFDRKTDFPNKRQVFPRERNAGRRSGLHVSRVAHWARTWWRVDGDWMHANVFV